MVTLLDWNLEQPPCFLEAEFIAGGSLVDWAQARGGLAAIPLQDRLEVVAQIAETLAAVHSVGVLHKDLKPSNVLVEPAANHAVNIRLADFGSGGVLDVKEIERLGITRLGFTKTITSLDSSSGTPLYLPPEVLAGQPFTVKADIYALGMILYQFLAGDFRKVMSPGWERGIADELLREDIAVCAEGNLEARLGDAAELARRLRTLGERHLQLQAERARAAKAERAQRALERAKARRVGLAAAVVVLVIGLIASTTLYLQARNARARAETEAQRAQAVSDFLSKDMFASLNSAEKPVKDVTAKEVLDAALGAIDKRFGDRPLVAAELDAAIGHSYAALNLDKASVEALSRALTIREYMKGAADPQTLLLAADLVLPEYVLGNLPALLPHFQELLVAGETALGSRDSAVVQLRSELSNGLYQMGDWVRAADELQKLVVERKNDPANQDQQKSLAFAQATYGSVLTDLSDYPDAEQQLRAAIAKLSSLFGDQHVTVASARVQLGDLLIETGRYADADAELSKAATIMAAWRNADDGNLLGVRYYQARARLFQGKSREAAEMLEEIVATLSSWQGGEMDQSAPAREALALAYAKLGRNEEAISMLRSAIERSTRTVGVIHPRTRELHIELAGLLIEFGDPVAAQANLMDDGKPINFDDLPENQVFHADLLCDQGLIASARGDRKFAEQALEKALSIYRLNFGSEDWRTQAVRKQLASL